MKPQKLIGIVVTLLFILSSQTTFAQDYKSALGVRVGVPIGATYKMSITEQGALDLRAGFQSSLFSSSRWRTVGLGAFYQHHFDISDILPGLYWYVGGGPTLNVYQYNDNDVFDDLPSISLGIRASVGLDYTLEDAPVNLGIDWSPGLFFSGVLNGVGWGYGAVSIRYVLSE